MQSVAVDDANPQSGEEAYILQVSIPSAPGVDGGALMDKIGRFVELYLTAAQPSDARFAQMGGTTWVIAASSQAAFALDQARADLATTLFGADDGAAVQLEWPDGVEPVDPNAVDAAAFDADAAENAEPESQSAYEPPAEEVPVLVAEAETDFETDESAEFDLGDDAWTLGDSAGETPPAQSTEESLFAGDDLDIDEITGSAVATEASAEAEGEQDAWSIEAAASAPTDASDAEDVFVIDDLNTGSADDLAEIVSDNADPASSSDRSEPELGAESDAAYTLEVASAAQRAAFDDTTDVFEVDAYDIEIVDSETGEVTEELSGHADFDVFDGSESEALETLTEVPDRPQTPDIAKELNAFRAEMREIASSIPGGGAGDLLADFRAELDAISGAMGQRVDGAAQRIEAAASQVVEASARLDAERLAEAAERAERSAQQLESGVAEALSALNAARNAMSGEGAAPATDAIG